MAIPFRIGVMQLTMEPLDEMLASARAMDAAGMDTVWLAEAYPWWRKHQMEARGSTVVSALMARETTDLTIGWGIISPYTRHPVQVAMDARVVQEAAGPGRFIVGFGTSKIFLNNTKQGGPPKVTKPLAHMRDSVEIVRGILGGERFEYDGKVFSADIPALSDEAHAPRWNVPVYVAGTAPMMQQIGGEIGDGLLTPSITTPDYVRYTAGNIHGTGYLCGGDSGCLAVLGFHLCPGSCIFHRYSRHLIIIRVGSPRQLRPQVIDRLLLLYQREYGDDNHDYKPDEGQSVGIHADAPESG